MRHLLKLSICLLTLNFPAGVCFGQNHGPGVDIPNAADELKQLFRFNRESLISKLEALNKCSLPENTDQSVTNFIFENREKLIEDLDQSPLIWPLKTEQTECLSTSYTPTSPLKLSIEKCKEIYTGRNSISSILLQASLVHLNSDNHSFNKAVINAILKSTRQACKEDSANFEKLAIASNLVCHLRSNILNCKDLKEPSKNIAFPRLLNQPYDFAVLEDLVCVLDQDGATCSDGDFFQKEKLLAFMNQSTTKRIYNLEDGICVEGVTTHCFFYKNRSKNFANKKNISMGEYLSYHTKDNHLFSTDDNTKIYEDVITFDINSVAKCVITDKSIDCADQTYFNNLEFPEQVVVGRDQIFFLDRNQIKSTQDLNKQELFELPIKSDTKINMIATSIYSSYICYTKGDSFRCREF